MKINENVLESYIKLCPVSAAKCESLADIETKIHRAITLGQVVDIKDGGKTLIVRYYELEFKVKNNRIVNMKRDRMKPPIMIDEKVKNKYNESIQIHNQWMVN